MDNELHREKVQELSNEYNDAVRDQALEDHINEEELRLYREFIKENELEERFKEFCEMDYDSSH